MLALQAEQLDALQRLDRARLAEALLPALAAQWPAVAVRLGERQREFVEAALAAAEREGLDTPLQRTGFVDLWCVWGPGFESRPGFEWARAILDARQRPAALRLHQLLQATRERLAAPGAGAPGASPAQWDAAVQRLPGIAAAAAAGGVFVCDDAPELLPAACDLAAVDIAVTNTEWRREYRAGEGGWLLRPAPPPATTLHVDAAPGRPVVLAVIGPPGRAAPLSQLRLRLQPQAQCDAARHPALTVDADDGRLHWQGRDALAIALPLLGPAPPTASSTAIAAEVEPRRLRLAVETCGARAAGQPIGPIGVEVQVFPSAQVLLECRVPPLPPLALPAAGVAPAPAAAAACRLECDGVAADAQAWTRAWQALAQRVAQGMERLLAAWSGTASLDQPRLEANVSALAGTSLLTWGCKEEGPADVVVRLEGQMDAACALDITLSGELTDGTSRARLRMRAQGRSDLRSTLSRASRAVDLAGALAAASASWRFPFEIDVEAVVGAGLASLVAQGPALPGALVGSAGLRPRDDGGCEWFFSLGVEPAMLATACLDPVLGVSTRSRALLPALALVEWSSG